MKIQFNNSLPVADEAERVATSLGSGHLSTGGAFAKQAAEALREATGAQDVLLTTSCTMALEMSALLLDFEPGDAVIVPSFTFSTSALAFAREGAQILFCDIEEATQGLDPASVADLIERAPAAGLRVRAVVAVHYAGIACRLEELQQVLAAHPEVTLIEDNAHGLFGGWQGKPLGSIGRFATQSFHETKNFSCGEGGALLVNDPADVDRARVLYDKGTNRRAFMLGQVDKYSWVDTGSSFGMAEPLAAFLTAQLDARELIQGRRRASWERYHAGLAPAAAHGVTLPSIPEGRESAYHMFQLLLPEKAVRDQVLHALQDDGIGAVFHYVPLHSSVAGRKFSGIEVDCPVSDDVSGRLLRLPFHNHLTDAEVDRVVERTLDAVAAATA